MGQRVGIHQEVTVATPWLVKLLRRAVDATSPGHTVMGLTPVQFRRYWISGRAALHLPARYTPYGVRRGGATVLFQRVGSFDRVMDKGRWASLQACRLYVTSALADTNVDEFEALRDEWERIASSLHSLMR